MLNEGRLLEAAEAAEERSLANLPRRKSVSQQAAEVVAERQECRITWARGPWHEVDAGGCLSDSRREVEVKGAREK